MVMDKSPLITADPDETQLPSPLWLFFAQLHLEKQDFIHILLGYHNFLPTWQITNQAGNQIL